MFKIKNQFTIDRNRRVLWSVQNSSYLEIKQTAIQDRYHVSQALL